MCMFTMGRKLGPLLFGLLVYVFLKTFNAETIKTSNSCLTTDEDLIQLTCNPGEMIHIISFLYQTASEGCNTVDGDCQVLVQSSDDTMIQSCNGRQTCNETISNEKIYETCNHRAPVYVTLTYGCISESPVDVCAETSQPFDQQLYLISPDYLKRTDDFPLVPCECNISGSDLTVEFLELNLPFFPEDRANVTLLGDSGSWSSNPVPNFVQYNKLVLNQTENVTLFYDAREKTRQYMWLWLRGSAAITVVCNVPIKERTPTTPNQTATAYVTTTIPNKHVTVSWTQNQGDNEAVIVAVLTSVLTVMVIIAVLLLVYLYRMKKQGDSEAGDPNPFDRVVYVNTQNTNGNIATEGAASHYVELNTGNDSATHPYEDLHHLNNQQEDNDYLEPVRFVAQRGDEIHQREIILGIVNGDCALNRNMENRVQALEEGIKPRMDCEKGNKDGFHTNIYESIEKLSTSGTTVENNPKATDGPPDVDNMMHSPDETNDQIENRDGALTGRKVEASPQSEDDTCNTISGCNRTDNASDYLFMHKRNDKHPIMEQIENSNYIVMHNETDTDKTLETFDNSTYA